MWKRVGWMLVLMLMVVRLCTPAQAAELVNPITLYQESVKVENMIKSGEKPALVLEAIDYLADMYTRLDMSNISQRIEGVQAVSSELVGLKQMYTAVKGPEVAVAEFRIHRLVIAFDSMAFPNSPAWLPIARSMENNLDKVIEAVAKQDNKTARTVLTKVRSERDQIWLALQLHGDPSELNLQQSAHRYVEQQVAGEQVTDKQETLDVLGSYKGSIGTLAAKINVVSEPPLLPVLHLTVGPKLYGSLSAAVLLLVGWRVFRKKKN
ncbi:MAG: sporulation protein YpjB [Tumebacillaceae bacterium]